MPHPFSSLENWCPRCQKLKTPDAFYRGKNVYCRLCVKEYAVQWARNNPERHKELKAASRKRPGPKQKQRDRVNKRRRELNQAMGGGFWRERKAKRRAAKLQRLPSWADRKAIRAIYEACPPGHHVDHIIPLRGETVSGLHVAGNLQYLPAEENLAKSNSF